MTKPSPRPAGAFFIADASPLAVELQRSLTNGPYRCNIMMVANGRQALAILRQEGLSRPEAALPQVLLIHGGLRDGRAAALLEVLRQDPSFGSIPVVALVGPQDEHDAVSSLVQPRPFSLDLLRPLTDQRGFWWVMAKLG